MARLLQDQVAARASESRECFALVRSPAARRRGPFRQTDPRHSQLRGTWPRESRAIQSRILADDTFVKIRIKFKSKNRRSENLRFQHLALRSQIRTLGNLPGLNFGRLGNQKLRRYDHGNKKSGGSIEQTNACLPANVCQMSEVPRN